MSEPDLTTRKKIIELLKIEPISFLRVANKLGRPVKDLEEDFEHISRSYKLQIEHAFCKKCGFEFKKDKRYHTPSKCPECRSEWIEGQRFWIQ